MKPRKSNSLQSASFKKKAFAYVLLIPFLLGFLLFFLKPLCLSVYYSLNHITLSGLETVYKFEGMQNYYNALFVDADFRTHLLTALKDLAINVPLILFFSLFVATLLNKPFYGRGFARIILFLPVIITTGVLLQLESTDYLIQAGQSALNNASENMDASATYETSLGLKELLLSLNMPDQVTSYISTVIGNFYTVLTSSGVQITLLLAAWQSIPSSLYEASAIEGATAWEDFWKITIPMISPYIFVCALYTIIDTFTSANNSLVAFVKDVATGSTMDYGLASAMSWLYFLMIAVILGLIALLFLRTHFVVYQDR
jgi:ABC transporter, permease protein